MKAFCPKGGNLNGMNKQLLSVCAGGKHERSKAERETK